MKRRTPDLTRQPSFFVQLLGPNSDPHPHVVLAVLVVRKLTRYVGVVANLERELVSLVAQRLKLVALAQAVPVRGVVAARDFDLGREHVRPRRDETLEDLARVVAAQSGAVPAKDRR